MKKIGWIVVVTSFTAFLAAILACQGKDGMGAAAGKGLSVYSEDAVVISKDLESKMRGPGKKRNIAEIQASLASKTDAQIYNPAARIQLDVVARGGYTPANLLVEARKSVVPGKYAICLIMGGLQNAVTAENPEEANQNFLTQYEQLLDYLHEQSIPSIACEIPLIVAAYQKPTYKMPAQEINKLIGQMNQDLYELALRKADGFVFTRKVFAGRFGVDKSSIILNAANSPVENGIQLTPEGMRLLGQLFASALHKAGYRDGRILLLGDTRISNEALTRPADKLNFLLPKYLEVELYKSCP